MRALHAILGLTGAGALSMCIAQSVQAQQIATVKLASPKASPSTEFTYITDLVELASSPPRVLVADQKENKLVLLDPSTSTATLVARTGSGPAEYRGLQNLASTATGGAFVIDFALRRLLPIDASGKPLDVIAYPYAQWKITDREGRMYGVVNRPMVGRNFPDTSTIVRWDPRTNRVDSLTEFNAGNSIHITHPGDKRKVFAPVDAWTVQPNGDVIVVEAATYRMLTFRGTKLVATAKIPFQPLPVTDADKKAFIKEEENATVVSIGQGGRGANSSGTRIAMQYDFPPTFPVFDNMSEDAVRVARNGDIWITRATGLRATAVTCDVLNSDGKLIAHVTLSKSASVLGFGANSVYIAEKDADDVQRIRQYAYPIFAGMK